MQLSTTDKVPFPNIIHFILNQSYSRSSSSYSYFPSLLPSSLHLIPNARPHPSPTIYLDRPQRDSIGKPHSRNLLESATKGFYWKASQQESFGKRHKGILLESLTAGILWKAPQRDCIGKPHNRNPLESATKGFY